MMPNLAFAALAGASALLLTGCAATQDRAGPSLAKRAVEGRLAVAPPIVPVAPPGPLPADLAGRLARWEADAGAGQQAFAAERSRAAALVAQASGAAVASERWAVAQEALSRLQASRAPLTAALADVDRLYIERSVEGAIDGMPDVYALRERLADLASAQDAILVALAGELAGA